MRWWQIVSYLKYDTTMLSYHRFEDGILLVNDIISSVTLELRPPSVQATVILSCLLLGSSHSGIPLVVEF